MAQYRLADEGQTSPAKKGAWNPTGLFFLVWLSAVFGGVAGPLVALFSVWNWKRLGQPKKFAQSAMILVPVLLLPFALTALRSQTGFPDRPLARTINFAAYLILAYWFLLGQKEAFEIHLRNGGKAASLLFPWLTGLLLVAALWAWIFWNRSTAI